MRGRAGFTLIELMIASFIGLLVIGAALSLNLATKTDVDRDESSFVLEASLMEAVTYLQHDFRYTTLASIRVYPRDGGEAPGASLIAGEPLGEFGRVQLSPFGTPNWQKYVYYTLLGQGDGTAQLVRYERPVSPTVFEFVSPHIPSSYQQSAGDRIVTKTLLDKGWSLTGERDNLLALRQDGASPGGFTVNFLHKDGSPTHLNPSEDDATTLSTGILEIELRLVDNSDLGKVSMLPFSFRVAPRN